MRCKLEFGVIGLGSGFPGGVSWILGGDGKVMDGNWGDRKR